MPADLDLGQLTEEEREVILNVLDRDTKLCRREQDRIKRLRESLRKLRMKGVTRGGEGSGGGGAESCSRCCEPFGWFFNKGVVCSQCHEKVCNGCHKVTPTKKIACVFCLKQMELEAKSGRWFYAIVGLHSGEKTKDRRRTSGTQATRGSAVVVHASMSVHGQRSSAASSNDEESLGGGVRRVNNNNGPAGDGSAYPVEEDKKLLRDLLDVGSFSGAAAAASTTKKPTSSSDHPSFVRVRQVYGSKYQDSDDDDELSVGSGSTGGVDSPHPSSCSGSGFKKSDSVRSSIQTNDSGDGINPLVAFAVENNNPTKGDGQRLGRVGRGSGRDDSLTEDDPSAAGRRNSTTSAESLWSNAAATSSVNTVNAVSSVDTVVDVAGEESSCTTNDNFHDQKKRSEMTEENNNDSRRQSSSPNALRFSVREDDDCDGVEKRSMASSSSADRSSTPSVARTTTVAVQANNEKNTSNSGLSDEENEDVGEMFAIYGSRKANSQSNLNKLSPFSGSKESINSCYSNAGEENYGKYPVTGEILMGLSYNCTLNILEVTIKRCKDLAPVDQKRKRSDPYVKTYLLPDRTKTGKRKTRIKKHTLNPVFDEILKYQISKSELESRTLNATVWNNDCFGRNDFLGEVNVALDYRSFGDSTPVWHRLQDRVLSPLSMLTYKGDLNLCLKFVSAEHVSGKRRSVSQKGELQIVIKEARNLTAVRSNGHSDPFCKGYLLPDKSHKTKQKTAVVKKNCNPKWNHTFLFENVSSEELQERSLELTIWDHDRLTSNDFLGGVRLNVGTGKSNGKEVTWMDARGEELSLWQVMLDRPDCWIEGTLLLRINMNQLK